MSSHKATTAIAMQLVLNKPPLFFLSIHCSNFRFLGWNWILEVLIP